MEPALECFRNSDSDLGDLGERNFRIRSASRKARKGRQAEKTLIFRTLNLGYLAVLARELPDQKCLSQSTHKAPSREDFDIRILTSDLGALGVLGEKSSGFRVLPSPDFYSPRRFVQSMLHGEQCRLRPIFQLQFGEHRADIALDRAFGEIQLF